jgi:hypothetical protein
MSSTPPDGGPVFQVRQAVDACKKAKRIVVRLDGRLRVGLVRQHDLQWRV